VSINKNLSRWKLVASSSWLAGQEFPLYMEGTSLGRGKSCDITIPGTHLSRNHAEIVFQGEQIQIKDLASSNGTFVNNEQVSEKSLADGDVLRLDVYSFTVVGPKSGQDESVPAVRASLNSSAAKSLENIRNMKNTGKDYSETQWITKPTSVGNRTHNVPSHGKGIDSGFWLGLFVGICLIGGLAYYFLN